MFDFAKEIHEYCKADVQLLKTGCIKFRHDFITDTGIHPFQSCTIAGACMNIMRTSHLKPNSIGRVSVNGYRSLRNYSKKSMEWIRYCEKITGVSYRHAWSVGGEMYLKKEKKNYNGVYYRAQKVYHLLSNDGVEVPDVHHVNDDCLYVIIASYVTTHARLEFYNYLEQLKDRALYCDTDSVIYRHSGRIQSTIK